MPRRGRLHIAGGIYHVMGRGLERRKILNGTVDKEDFLSRLAQAMEETQSQCLAWALMSNHYHLLIRVGATPLSELMRKVLGGYASQYNRRHKRVGYVFQNRFKSILCNEEDYLLELVRYIHLNPLRAKMITTLAQLDRYNWTGHGVIMGNKRRPWQERQEILTRFSKKRAIALKRYRTFIQDGINQTSKIDYSGGGLIRSYGGWENILKMRRDHEARVGDERILGESDFVQQTLKEDEIQMTEQSRLQRKGWDLEKLTQRVCEKYKLDPSEIMNKGRANKISIAKHLICHWGRSKLGLTATEIALRLNISTTAVAKATKKGRHYEMETGVHLMGL